MVRIEVKVGPVWRKIQGLVFKRRTAAEETLKRLNSYREGQEYRVVGAKR